MAYSFTARKRFRKSFGRIQSATSLPNLIEVQKNSYDRFLQMDVPAESRDDVAQRAAHEEVFLHEPQGLPGDRRVVRI